MRTTEKHVKMFKAECLRLQTEWGLSEWKLYFSVQASEDWYAMCSPDPENGEVVITLTNDWPASATHKLSDENILSLAKHEMLHVLLATLAHPAQSRFASKDELEAAEHRLLTRLMKLI